ncbi:MAG: serine hydrolase [Myxococcales bacterium]|nr:serine hydrolase [Myxococcales bacterium]
MREGQPILCGRHGFRAATRWSVLAGVLLVTLLAMTSDAAARKPVRGSSKRAHVAAKKKRVVARSRPIPVYTRSGLPNIQAAAAVIVDVGAGGAPLYQKNPEAVRPIASISKLMAMLVVLERNLDLKGHTTITAADAKLTTRGAKSRLLVGMTLTNQELLHAALMASDNRAVLALGRAVGLLPSAFAEAMTARARSLGLKKTTFGDPTGLDYRNVSTPREVVAMLQAALKNPHIAEASRATQYVVRSTTRPRDSVEYSNTDLLLRSTKHVIHGGKTGYNDRAGYCLVVAARILGGSGGGNKPREVVMAFLGEEGKLTRFADFGRAAQWLVERAPPVRTLSQASPATASAHTPQRML